MTEQDRKIDNALAALGPIIDQMYGVQKTVVCVIPPMVAISCETTVNGVRQSFRVPLLRPLAVDPEECLRVSVSALSKIIVANKNSGVRI